jgi:hypothetical protein
MSSTHPRPPPYILYTSLNEVCNRIDLKEEADEIASISQSDIATELFLNGPHSLSNAEASFRNYGWDDDERGAHISLEEFILIRNEHDAGYARTILSPPPSSSELPFLSSPSEHGSVIDVFRDVKTQREYETDRNIRTTPSGFNPAYHIPAKLRQTTEWYYDDGTNEFENIVSHHDAIQRYYTEQQYRRYSCSDDTATANTHVDTSDTFLLLPSKFNAMAYM